MATIEQVGKELHVTQRHWKIGRKAWSCAYHSLQIGAIGLAAITTLGTARKWDSTVTLWFATATTVATALTGLLRPAEKWRSNRLSYSEAEEIRLDLMKENASADRALSRLQRLLIRHDMAILGDVGLVHDAVPDHRDRVDHCEASGVASDDVTPRDW